MLYFSKEGELINTESGNLYYKKAMQILDDWNFGKTEFEIKTSGSTGIPKTIKLRRGLIEASIEMTKKTFDLYDGHLFFCCLNIENIAGLMMLLRSQCLKGELMLVEPSSNPFEKLGNLDYLFFDNRGQNVFAFVPLQLQKLLENEKYVQILKTAKTILVGGAAMNAELKAKIAELYLPVYETYGMTETITHIAIKNILLEEDTFKTLESVETKLNDLGCLMIKSPTTNFEWISTNDIVEIIDDETFKLIGRFDNVINSGGVKIQLEEIERKIEENFKIESRYFCYGIPDEKLGQKLILIVESKEKPISKEQLSTILSKFEVPKEIYFVEQFSETSSSKVDKRKTIDEILNS
ncbi:O-succinylbenzoic acid--CoA ligase [Spirosomataceae bacterium]|jgi:O-succinylbenzoic acid--CoA ligase